MFAAIIISWIIKYTTKNFTLFSGCVSGEVSIIKVGIITKAIIRGTIMISAVVA